MEAVRFLVKTFALFVVVVANSKDTKIVVDVRARNLFGNYNKTIPLLTASSRK